MNLSPAQMSREEIMTIAKAKMTELGISSKADARILPAPL
jgi:hypothetical protein